jgi:hypothetical protein
MVERSGKELEVRSKKREDADPRAEWKRLDFTRPSQMEVGSKKRKERQPVPQ